MTTAPIVAGAVFGRWTVLSRGENDKLGRARWNVECACKKTRLTAATHLRSGKSQSCGCLHRERAREAKTKHGGSRRGAILPEYQVWKSIIGRCTRPTNAAFASYGGRGIGVCARWRESFPAFMEDMGARPSDDHSVERRDNERGYEPGNCYWATRTEQNNNTRVNRRVTFHGETLTAAQWAARLGLNAHTLRRRLRAGWSPEKALTNDGALQ